MKERLLKHALWLTAVVCILLWLLSRHAAGT